MAQHFIFIFLDTFNLYDSFQMNKEVASNQTSAPQSKNAVCALQINCMLG